MDGNGPSTVSIKYAVNSECRGHRFAAGVAGRFTRLFTSLLLSIGLSSSSPVKEAPHHSRCGSLVKAGLVWERRCMIKGRFKRSAAKWREVLIESDRHGCMCRGWFGSIPRRRNLACPMQVGTCTLPVGLMAEAAFSLQ